MTKKLMVVVPCYNEESSLTYLIDSLEVVRKQISHSYLLDVLLVNDGSLDGTQLVIEKLCKAHDYVYFRKLSLNAGHQSALRAGLDISFDYDATITMDADMQHSPLLIPKMLDAWEKGANIVQMVRQDSAREVGISKYLLSRCYYMLMRYLSDGQLEYGASDFRLLDKTVTDILRVSPENDLFLRGYFSRLPINKTAIYYKPNVRIAGQTKYNMRMLLHMAGKSVLQFSDKPLRIAVVLGAMLALVSFLYGLALIILYVNGLHAGNGWTSLIAVVLFCFGINFLLLGIIGQYLAYSINLQRHRPEYVIDKEFTPVTGQLKTTLKHLK